jgi:hypothetical protein
MSGVSAAGMMAIKPDRAIADAEASPISPDIPFRGVEDCATGVESNT